MAHRIHRDYQHVKTKAVELTARLRGGGAATSLSVEDDDSALPSEIVSATYSATGTFTVVFRHKYPRLLKAPSFSFVGNNGGMTGKCTAIDVTAGTATFLISYNSTPTDPATTDYLYVAWTCSNGSTTQ